MVECLYLIDAVANKSSIFRVNSNFNLVQTTLYLLNFSILNDIFFSFFILSILCIVIAKEFVNILW